MMILGRLVWMFAAFFRALEWISVHVCSTGKFSNTDSKICRQCLISGIVNHKHCIDCKQTWLLDLDYGARFWVVLYTVCGLSWIGIGWASMWCAYAGRWWGSCEGIKKFRIMLLYHTTLPIDPAYYPLSNVLLTLSLYVSVFLALTTCCAITAPLFMNMRYKKVTKKQAGWALGLGASGMATLLLKHFKLVEDLEIDFVVLPCIVGLWFLEAAIWACVEGYLNRSKARGGGAGVNICGNVRIGGGWKIGRELEAGKKMLE